MSEKGTIVDYFLAANSSSGFVSFFDELSNPEDDWRLFILKGGPGTGKSSLMKAIGAHMSALGKRVEFLHCSSDPSSLDGIILWEDKVCFSDGTAPHVMT